MNLPKKDPKDKKRNSKFDTISGYLLSIAVSFMFALFCSWRIGIFLLLTLVLAPILSLVLAFVFRHTIKVEVQVNKQLVAKKERLQLTVSLRNRFVLPTPGVLIEPLENPCVSYGDVCYEMAAMPFSGVSLDVPVMAEICGASQVGIGKVWVQDYLGLLRLAVPLRLSQTLAVIPDVAEISGDEEYIRQTYVLSTTTGESDETVEASTNVMGGFPGYDHREYVPGDPLKRINWKLSARRDDLFVRLDDELAASSVVLVLDPVEHVTEKDIAWLPGNLYENSSVAELPALIRQNAMETSLGVAMTLLNRNLKVMYCFFRDGRWERTDVTNVAQVTSLQQELASYSFVRECSQRFPFAEAPERGAAFICTACRYTEVPFREVIVYSSLDGKGRKL